MFELEEDVSFGATIKVVGIGGGGGNAVATMASGKLKGVEFILANTDRQSLYKNNVSRKIQLGSELTKGLGAGSDPEIGKRACLESVEDIKKILAGADMVFITAGMGGGTGTGGAPIVAKIARELGVLTVGVVTKPFLFEGKKRCLNAHEGIQELKKNVDTLIVIPNQKLLDISCGKTPLLDAFKKADEVLLNAVEGISSLINVNGLINLDFADVKTVMHNKGLALMGMGVASGDRRAIQASNQAISSPLLENVSIDGATGIIINITGSKNLSLHEINEASTFITEAASENADIIFGAVIDDTLKEHIKVTVIATGFESGTSHIRSVNKPGAIKSEPSFIDKTSSLDFELGDVNFQKDKNEDAEKELLSKKEMLLVKAKAYKNFQQNSKGLFKNKGLNKDPKSDTDLQNSLDIPAYIRRQKTHTID